MRSKNYIIFILAALFLVLSGCASLQSVFRNPRYTYEDNAILVRGDDRPIELENNREAVDVSYADLLAFIRQDATDKHPYVPRDAASGAAPFVCSDFAETVHNNAEAAGIRAGYMTIDFIDGGVGHAVNVFQTPDMGMVCIDCTGKSDYSQLEDGAGSEPVSGWDKVAYVEVGKKLGVIPLDKARSPAYDFYEEFERGWQEYKEKLAAYNAEVIQYNLEIADKVYRRGSSEYARIKDWEARLEEQENYLMELDRKIGTIRFKPLAIVKSTNIHW
jgi:hypothetical protein